MTALKERIAALKPDAGWPAGEREAFRLAIEAAAALASTPPMVAKPDCPTNCHKHRLGTQMCGCGGGYCGVDDWRCGTPSSTPPMVERDAEVQPTNRELELAMLLGSAEGTLRFVATVCQDKTIVKQVLAAMESLKVKPASPSGEVAADLESLRKLAMAATPGRWLHRHDPGNPVGVQHGVKLQGEFGAWICDCLDNADKRANDRVAGERNAAYIAACSPDVILALLDRAAKAPQEAVDGYVLVPVDLPPEMRAVIVNFSMNVENGKCILFDDFYSELLAAAPKGETK